MKVALFTETYFPSVNGVAAHVKTLRDGLVKLGHEVLVVTADKHCKHHYVEDGVLHCPSIEIKRFYGFGAAAPISRKRFHLIADFTPDIIHIHHEFGIGLSGITSAKRLGIPLVYTLHTMYDQYIYYIAPPPLVGAATKLSHKYEYLIASNANALTGPSKKCDEHFKRIGIQKPISIIPNSADLEAFDPQKLTEKQRQETRSRFCIPQDCTVACFAGRLGQEKSVDLLLEYWAQAIRPEDNFRLMIIGGGPEQSSLEALAQKLGIRGMVTFTGMVQHDDMPNYYAACDIYVTASLSDTNSISMLEAMATGMPTLQRYDELNLDQIQSGVNGYMFDSAEQMAQQLRDIASLDPEQNRKLKQSAIESVRHQGAVDLAKYLLGVYQQAIEDKSSAPEKTSRSLVRIRLKR